MWDSIRRHRHPDERTLALAGLTPLEARDPALTGHLATCERCRDALALAEARWADARAGAEADADAVFTEAVLDRQRAHVLRRLEQQGHPARVLPFPLSSPGWSATRPIARRWIAAAAAAGLLVGVITGRWLPARRDVPAPQAAAAGASAPAATGERARHPGQRGPEVDEAFLVDLEMAAASPRIEPLRVLDAMTPRSPDGRR